MVKMVIDMDLIKNITKMDNFKQKEPITMMNEKDTGNSTTKTDNLKKREFINLMNC